jgi:hemoglobin/transferrin/lactoferrin receptor protein
MPGGPPFNSILDLDFFDDTGEDVKSFGYDVQASFLLGHHNILTAGTSLFRDHSRDNPFQLLNINIIGFATIPPAPPMFIPMLIPILQNNISFPQVVPISNFRNAGFFAQDEFDVTPWLRLIGGGRVDQFHVNSVNTPNYDPTLMGGISGAQPPIDLSALPTANGSTIDRTAVTGDFGVVVRPRSVFSVSARIGRSYRHPNLEELFFSGPGTIGDIVANTKLKPETGLNFDLDLHVRTKRFGGTVGYFNNLYRNFISTQIISVSPTIGPISQAINFAKVRLQGLEGSMEIPVHAGSTQFTVFTNLSYLHGQVLNGFNFFTSTSIADTPADNITPFKIVPGLRWQDKEGRWWWEYAARVETHVNRASPVRLTSPFLTAEDLWGLNGFTVHSLKGGYSLFKGERSPVAITVGLENLGNKFYREQFVFGPARGRSLTVGLSLRYF